MAFPSSDTIEIPPIHPIVEGLEAGFKRFSLRDMSYPFNQPTIQEYNAISEQIEALFTALATRVTVGILFGTGCLSNATISNYPDENPVLNKHANISPMAQPENLVSFLTANRSILNQELQLFESFPSHYNERDKRQCIIDAVRYDFQAEMERCGLPMPTLLEQWQNIEKLSNTITSGTLDATPIQQPFHDREACQQWRQGIAKGAMHLAQGILAVLANVSGQPHLAGSVATMHFKEMLAQGKRANDALTIDEDDVKGALWNIGRLLFKESRRTLESAKPTR